MRSIQLLLALALALPVAAQSRTVGGTVVDAASGEPIRGAILRHLSGQGAAVTDSTGTFVVRIPIAGDSLVVTRLGYGPATFAVGGSEELQVRLTRGIVAIDGITATLAGVSEAGSSSVISSCDFGFVYGSQLVQADPLALLERHFGYTRTPCRAGGGYCSVIRGTIERIDLYVDGVLQPNGLADLAKLAPGEVAYAEIRNGRRTVSVVTDGYQSQSRNIVIAP